MISNKELIKKALALKNEQNYEAALEILEGLYQKESENKLIRTELIQVLFEYGGYLNDDWLLEYEKAAEIFKKIIELEPDNYRAWYNLGIAYYNLERIDEALNAYQEALKIKPNYMYCYYNIGLIYENVKGDLKKALEYYEKALTYNKSFSYAVQARSSVREKLDNLILAKTLDLQKFDENKLYEKEKTCNICGNLNRNEAKFCDKCGGKF